MTLPITHGSGARESWASFGPKGEKVVYVTDESHEEAIAVADSYGRGRASVVMPAGASGWHFPPVFSPDGKCIAVADQTQTLWIVPAAGGTPTKVDRGDQDEIRQYTWSPDGRFLAYSKRGRTDYQGVFVYDTQGGGIHAVSGPYTNDSTPAWDPEGRYLYFLSDRTINPMLDWIDAQYTLIRPTKPYAVLLHKDVENPFAKLEGLPGRKKKDEGKEESHGGDGDTHEKESGGKKDGGEKDKDKIVPVKIDFEGLTDRIVPFPVDPDNYGALAATGKKVFYLRFPVQGMAEEGGDDGPRNALVAFDLEEKKDATFVDRVGAYAIAPKAGKIAVQKKPDEIYVVDAGSPPGDKLEEKRVKLDGVVLELDPREEWTQIYYEGWRHMRDFYWDKSMGGVDWVAIRDQYATLLPRLATREDLRDLMGEVIGELSTSHTYVWGGDPGVKLPQVATGVLGAEIVRAGDAFEVKRIYRGDPADNIRSPLSEPEASVKDGDYILAVDHRPFGKDRPFEAALEGLAGKPVVLTVNGKPGSEGARDVVVTPVSSDGPLRYADWVRRNREYVAKKTGGKMGYLHIPDMGADGLVRFNTWFFPQLDKEGLVIDARWNRGGFVSQMILERLRRVIVSFDRSRGGGVYSYPGRTLNGPFVVLTNEFAGSDGDIFPYSVQMLGLAPVIGVRSWGGVVGIRGDKPMVDGGALTQPEYAWWDPKRGWDLENHGVDPDIEIDDLPQELGRGVDAQLDKGIEVLLDLRAKHPPIKPEFGPAKMRNRDAYKGELGTATP
ncbi:MAG: S41 family peptidase [Acidobacteriota bacterium]